MHHYFVLAPSSLLRCAPTNKSISHNVELVKRFVGADSIEIKTRSIDALVLTKAEQFGNRTTRTRRLLKPVPAKSIDKVQIHKIRVFSNDSVLGEENREMRCTKDFVECDMLYLIERIVLVPASPSIDKLDSFKLWDSTGDRGPYYLRE